jgi:hypothetical protein
MPARLSFFAITLFYQINCTKLARQWDRMCLAMTLKARQIHKTNFHVNRPVPIQVNRWVLEKHIIDDALSHREQPLSTIISDLGPAERMLFHKTNPVTGHD